MRLYAGMSREFIDHAVHNRIASLLRDAFERVYRHRPSPGKRNRGEILLERSHRYSSMEISWITA